MAVNLSMDLKHRSDPAMLWLLGGTLGVLVLASVIGWALAKRATSDAARATVANLNARTKAWWGMVAVFAGALAVGPMGATLMFFFRLLRISFVRHLTPLTRVSKVHRV